MDNTENADAGGRTPAPSAAFDINDWIARIIEGVGGMNDKEKYELVIWNESDHMAAARWTLKCLANPLCEGSDRMLQAIMERRVALAE